MASPSAPVSPAVRSITIPRDANQRITTDSALQPIVTLFFTRSPWGGQLVFLLNLCDCFHYGENCQHQRSRRSFGGLDHDTAPLGSSRSAGSCDYGGWVCRLVITHKDRLLRFGAELVFAICEAKNVEVVILNQGEDTGFEEDLAKEDFEEDLAKDV